MKNNNNAVSAFIKDAIEGGWRWTISGYDYTENVFDEYEGIEAAVVLLDKDAWIAVCKTRDLVATKTMWRTYMHEFIDHLADGKSIEEALAALS